MYVQPQVIVVTKKEMKEIMANASSYGGCRASGTCVGVMAGGCVSTPQQGI